MAFFSSLTLHPSAEIPSHSPWTGVRGWVTRLFGRYSEIGAAAILRAPQRQFDSLLVVQTR